MESKSKILSLEFITHDVIHIVIEKPSGLSFTPGQAVDLSLAKQSWEKELRAFTITSLPEDEQLEFTIKTYASHNGLTQQLSLAKKGDELIIHDVFGDISYKGEGIFIAGGAGVTPFIAILKQLEKNKSLVNHKLIFANKTKSDIILEEKLKELLGENFINVLSEEKVEGYEYGFITADLIKKHIDNTTKYFYLCGPDPMMNAVEKQLQTLGVSEDYIVREGF